MKKIITLLLVVALLATCMVTSAFAAKTGDTVSVSFTVSNPGASTFGAKINYDKSALELVSIEAGKLTSGGLFTANVKTGKVAYVSTDNITGSGTVFVAKFKVLNAAEAGKTYNVSASVDGANTVNASGQKVSFSISGGSVKVDKVCAHKWSSWKTTKEPTCGEAGTQKRTCSLCGKVETRSIAATGNHTWGEWTVTTAPTCCNAGEETHTCSVCGATETREVAATGLHNWGEWTVVTAATCSAEKTRTCADCGEVETAAVEKLAHTWGAWETDGEKHWHTCSACGHTEMGEHDYVNGTCSVCGAAEPGEDKAGFPWWIILIILLVVAAAVAVYFYLKNKKK